MDEPRLAVGGERRHKEFGKSLSVVDRTTWLQILYEHLDLQRE